MNVDYHVHSNFSDDSKETMEKQIERAIQLGLSEICFTDHVDYGIKKDWSEGDIEYRTTEKGVQPLANVDYPKYFEKLTKMKETYGSSITIRNGLEFGIQTITIKQFENLYKQYKSQLDFVLLSMHQVNNQEFWTQDFQKGKSQEEYNQEYYQEIYKVMRKYKDYSVLAHLDLLTRYDLQGVYPFEKVEDIIAQILKQAILDNKGIEINTSSWHYGLLDTQPSRSILKLYKDLGGKIITIGSDAHSTKYLGDHISEAKEILKEEIGFEYFCTFEKMEPSFIKL